MVITLYCGLVYRLHRELAGPSTNLQNLVSMTHMTLRIIMCSGGDEDSSCGVNLINEGVTVSGDCARFQFTRCGMVESYQCKLNKGDFKTCEQLTLNAQSSLGQPCRV